MNTERYALVGQNVGPAVWQPASQHLVPPTAPALTLYQVPVPGAVQVQLPDGRIAWGRPVEQHLDPLPPPAPKEPLPAWAKAIGMVAGSLTALALGGALALRIAAPALGDLVDLLDTLWKVTLALAVILFGGLLLRSRMSLAADSAGSTASDHGRPTVVFAPEISTGGTRLLGRSGDVNIQCGNSNRNTQ
jgi:hypothetical protein